MPYFDKKLALEQLKFFVNHRQQYSKIVKLVQNLDIVATKELSDDSLYEFHLLFNQFINYSSNLIFNNENL